MNTNRSILSVPGNIKKMHLKAAESNVDIVMLDLEDSVSIDDKAKAREIVANSINELDWNSKTVTFRINNCNSEYAYEDIIDVVAKSGNKISRIVIPKVENSDEIHFADKLLSGIEQKYKITNQIGIEASIETARGLMNIEKIAQSSDRIETLIFGIADYSASVGAKNVSISGHGENEEAIYPGHRWHFVLSKIIMVAKANNLLAIDAPFGNFRDYEGLKKSCMMSRSLGMDGKWAIHPNQIDDINRIFSPDAEEIEYAKKIIEAEKNSKGAIALEGKMIDQATLRLARITYEKAKNLGML